MPDVLQPAHSPPPLSPSSPVLQTSYNVEKIQEEDELSQPPAASPPSYSPIEEDTEWVKNGEEDLELIDQQDSITMLKSKGHLHDKKDVLQMNPLAEDHLPSHHLDRDQHQLTFAPTISAPCVQSLRNASVELRWADLPSYRKPGRNDEMDDQIIPRNIVRNGEGEENATGSTQFLVSHSPNDHLLMDLPLPLSYFRRKEGSSQNWTKRRWRVTSLS
ncbi:hypothetical protein BT69DRAFT_1283190 [Atractiella rhizophila]|nr:hypothetical protein BT69DRAFT_1290984 [Atractiella rhizophila]KAH8921453.1 hypothetical protein BT69DRAFT_1283190 [Atractiella rhizophila]